MRRRRGRGEGNGKMYPYPLTNESGECRELSQRGPGRNPVENGFSVIQCPQIASVDSSFTAKNACAMPQIDCASFNLRGSLQLHGPINSALPDGHTFLLLPCLLLNDACAF